MIIKTYHKYSRYDLELISNKETAAILLRDRKIIANFFSTARVIEISNHAFEIATGPYIIEHKFSDFVTFGMPSNDIEDGAIIFSFVNFNDEQNFINYIRNLPETILPDIQE